MSENTIMTYWPILVGGGGAIATITWLWKTGRNIVKKLVDIRDDLQAINGIEKDLKAMHFILTPNGGSSMMDKVNALVEAQDSAAHQFIKTEEWQNNFDIRLKSVELALIEMKRQDAQMETNRIFREGSG